MLAAAPVHLAHFSVTAAKYLVVSTPLQTTSGATRWDGTERCTSEQDENRTENTAYAICFLHMLTCVCVRSKAWLATLAAAPVLLAHTFGPCHMEKT